MTKRSVEHATFTIERRFDAPPARVFAAWSKPENKARWATCHGDWQRNAYEMDFRPGGHEVNRQGPEGGPMHIFQAHYHDIVPEQRIVYSYDMHLDEVRLSASLATILFEASGSGTRMVFTEQAAIFDGHGTVAERKAGTELGFDSLQQELARQMASA